MTSRRGGQDRVSRRLDARDFNPTAHASDAAIKLASKRGISLRNITGSGPKGKIVFRDVKAL